MCCRCLGLVRATAEKLDKLRDRPGLGDLGHVHVVTCQVRQCISCSNLSIHLTMSQEVQQRWDGTSFNNSRPMKVVTCQVPQDMCCYCLDLFTSPTQDLNQLWDRTCLNDLGSILVVTGSKVSQGMRCGSPSRSLGRIATQELHQMRDGASLGDSRPIVVVSSKDHQHTCCNCLGVRRATSQELHQLWDVARLDDLRHILVVEVPQGMRCKLPGLLRVPLQELH
mmetsp:Transcript_100421/g.224304  ORF Transcript_100421/g.224304 Transcript_100421/m.224304 type:complete len:224 (+) Transcript_100421:1518-2189(+)